MVRLGTGLEQAAHREAWKEIAEAAWNLD